MARLSYKRLCKLAAASGNTHLLHDSYSVQDWCELFPRFAPSSIARALAIGQRVNTPTPLQARILQCCKHGAWSRDVMKVSKMNPMAINVTLCAMLAKWPTKPRHRSVYRLEGLFKVRVFVETGMVGKGWLTRTKEPKVNVLGLRLQWRYRLTNAGRLALQSVEQ